MFYTLDPREFKELSSQVDNPQHCFLVRPSGRYFSHRLSDLENPLRGTPIRLTQLAANRVKKQLSEDYFIEMQVVPAF